MERERERERERFKLSLYIKSFSPWSYLPYIVKKNSAKFDSIKQLRKLKLSDCSAYESIQFQQVNSLSSTINEFTMFTYLVNTS